MEIDLKNDLSYLGWVLGRFVNFCVWKRDALPCYQPRIYIPLSFK